ncbi:glycosyltransferase family 2 protein [Deinococcus sp. UYEF24]
MNSPKVSVIVNNFNYQDYIGQAIESALEQTYKNIEVIVVDDGSTDSSRDVINSFGSSIQCILKDNGGQASAFNTGFSASTGDLILFLDSDDYLTKDCVEKIVKRWNRAYTKIHWRMKVVNKNGNKFGSHPPESISLDSGDLTSKLMSSGSYICSPTSGNMFSRGFLEFVMPIPEKEYRISADGYLLTHAALYGEIGSLEEELTYYRVHGNNAWAMDKLNIDRIKRFIIHEEQKMAIVKEFCISTSNMKNYKCEFLNISYNMDILVYGKMSGAPFLSNIKHIIRFSKATWYSRDLFTRNRMKVFVWIIFCSIIPKQLSQVAISWLYAPASRPWKNRKVFGKKITTAGNI